MVQVNSHFLRLQKGYLFPRVEKKKNDVLNNFPDAEITDLGIGDITYPMLSIVAKTYQKELVELSKNKVVGYGPSEGYPFLKKEIAQKDYYQLGIEEDEIFLSNGAKNDAAHLLDLFSPNIIIGLCDPSYPVYLDSSVMHGASGDLESNGRYEKFLYLDLTEDNGFIPQPPEEHCDLIYLCSPNNPTGVAIDYDTLEKWVTYAKEHNAIIIYDAAYEAFITQSCPKSIYEIPGAKKVAIEIKSYSKTAGFTGLRCSYSVVPKTLLAHHNKKSVSMHSLWKRRHQTKFGGVNYLTQCAAYSLYSEEGQKELTDRISIYQNQTQFLREGLEKLGYIVYGGIDAPYMWVKTPNQQNSWEFFDYLLEDHRIVCLPGSGFGIRGEGYVRFSAFAKRQTLTLALQRLGSTLSSTI